MPWGEEHERSPEAERAAMVKDCVDAMRAAVAVYDEMIPKLGEARVKLVRRLLELEGVDGAFFEEASKTRLDSIVPEVITFGPRSGRTQEEAEIEGRRRVAENKSRLNAGVLVLPDEVDDFEREAALQAEPGRMVDDGGGIMSMTAPPWRPVPDADGAAPGA